MHAIRRNRDITNIVHNSMVYGLTKGQASPTSQIGFKTPAQVDGVFLEPFNPTAVAIALNASFVARAFAGDGAQTKETLEKAVTHKGHALVDIFQPCISFNRVQTHQWFKEHTYYLDDSHDPYNRIEAFKISTEREKLPLGILYMNPDKTTFKENLGVYQDNQEPLYKREFSIEKLRIVIQAKKKG